MKRLTTYDEVENLCEAMIMDFMRCKHYTDSHCVDIEAFVTEYLGVPIVYETFAEDDPGRIGFLSDGKRPVKIIRDNRKMKILFPKDTAVIDKYLQKTSELGRMRFTIAHEGAHHIMNKHIPAQATAAFHSEYDCEMEYSYKMLQEMMSMNESLANRAAACLLMPRFIIMRVLNKYNGGKKVVAFDGYVLSQEQKFNIQKMADAMGVNYSALFNRLKELDLFDLHPIEEYLSKFKCGGVV